MQQLTPEQREQAARTSLERAIERFPDYDLDRIPGTNRYVVYGGAQPYEAGEDRCTCPHAACRGVKCLHQWMAEVKLDQDGRFTPGQIAEDERLQRLPVSPTPEEKRRQAMEFRGLWD